MKNITQQFFFICLVCVLLSSCSDQKATKIALIADLSPEESRPTWTELFSDRYEITLLETTSGDILVELYPDKAPETVANFLKYVDDGFYNNTIFHRVIPGFMIQGGCPQGNGMGGPGYEIDGEFSANGHKNDLKHTLGVLSMARTMAPNSAGSQFFIMVADAPHLDGQYAAFGKVTEGMDVVDKIAKVKTTTVGMYQDVPSDLVVITGASRFE